MQVSPLDSIADCVTLLRLLVSCKLEAPLWRQGRPALLLEGATFSKAAPDAAAGTLVVDAYVREAALTANQALSVPGAGDFSIDKIWAAPEQVPLKGRSSGMAVEQSGELPLLAAADDDRCGGCFRPRMAMVMHACREVAARPRAAAGPLSVVSLLVTGHISAGVGACMQGAGSAGKS